MWPPAARLKRDQPQTYKRSSTKSCGRKSRFTQPGCPSCASTWPPWSAMCRKGSSWSPWACMALGTQLETAGMPDEAEEGGDSEATCLIPSCACPSGDLQEKGLSFLQLVFRQSSATCMILLSSFSLKTARSPVPLLRRILLWIPPLLLHPRMKRLFRNTSPTHPCRRLQRIPPTMSTVCRILPCAHTLKCLRMKKVDFSGGVAYIYIYI